MSVQASPASKSSNVWITVADNDGVAQLSAATDAWGWAVPRDTRRGDLVLLWITGGIGLSAVFDVIDDPRPARRDEHGPKQATLRRLAPIEPPINLSVLREDSTLAEWSIVRANMQGAVIAQKASLTADHQLWDALRGLLVRTNSALENLLPGVAASETQTPVEAAQRPTRDAPATEPNVPFDLQQYSFSAGANNLLTKAADRLSREGAVSTTLVLFEAIEQGRRGPDGYWIADFMRQQTAGREAQLAEVKQQYMQSRSSRQGHPAQYMTAGLAAALELAKDIARRTTGEDLIAARHLVAALLIPPPAQHRYGAATRLERIGLDAALIREQLYRWLRGYGDNEEAWRECLFGSTPIPRRLSEFHADTAGGQDLLSIEQDVLALATLIAARSVAPPLSIGLFGEWGSGKTFFMRQLRSAVAQLSREARNLPAMQRDLPFYKHIIQIEFNAWHYVEGNLWASLVEHIFDNLRLPDDQRPLIVEQMQKHWIDKLGFAEQTLAQTNERERAAVDKVDQAERTLETLQQQHDQKKEDLQRLSAQSVARDFRLAGAYDAVVKALEPLGLKPLGDAVPELQSSLRQARGVVERGNTVLTPLLHASDRANRWRSLLIILVGAPAAALAVGVVLALLGAERISQIAAFASGTAVLFARGADWIRAQAAWMSKHLQQVEDANRVYDEALAKALASTAQEIARTEQELALARQDYTAARQRVEQAVQERDAIRNELAQTTSARLLGRFIEDRASSVDYRKHLGLLALVRDDFERLSELIEGDNWQLSPEGVTDPRFDGRRHRFSTLEEENKEAAHRINRIVLYIDDLDRCPPAKVVEVLQAVHLLLAFPLFVVVVGVDARWISRSLESRYRELLHVSQPDATNSIEIVGAVRSEDYLEKIFQIPLWLGQMTPANVRAMVQGLLRPVAVKPPVGAASGSSTAARLGVSAGDDRRGETTHDTHDQPDRVPEQPQEVVPSDTTAASQVPSPSKSMSGIPNVESLEIRGFELESMDALSPLLGRSPRALKRFINVYRLIKARMSPAEHGAFLRRTNGELGDYEAVLILLAVDTGLPEISRRVFDALLEHAQKHPKKTDLDSLKSALDEAFERSTPEWDTLKAWISAQGVTADADDVAPKLAKWVPVVSRYSLQAARLDAR
jgi:hypothetical protein